MSVADELAFDPSAATVIRTPPGRGYGYWVGGSKVSYDPASGLFTLFYRVRSPLESGRGGECRVAQGTDGISFEDVWSATKDELAALSIEVGHCLPIGDEWRLYVSYQFAATNEWRIDVVTGESAAGLDTQGRRTVLSPGDYGLAWIKDPWVVRSGGDIDLYAAVPARRGPQVEGNVVTAGPIDATVVATSSDGLYFPTIEYVFESSAADTWGDRRARLNSLFEFRGQQVATFDGGRTFYDNYEEWAGLAVAGADGSFERLTTDGPWVVSPHGSVRYVYGLAVEGSIYFYFEYTLVDGSHDLRVAIVTP